MEMKISFYILETISYQTILRDSSKTLKKVGQTVFLISPRFQIHNDSEFQNSEMEKSCAWKSAQYTQKLLADDFDAYNLGAGILAWVHAGRPVVDPQGAETRRVHVYGAKWDLLPEGYEGVW